MMEALCSTICLMAKHMNFHPEILRILKLKLFGTVPEGTIQNSTGESRWCSKQTAERNILLNIIFFTLNAFSRDFRSDTNVKTLYWLEWMLTVKKRYDPSIIHYDGLENLDRVIADRDLSQEEVQMLYQLLGR